jgi:hypothetical protein
MSILTRKNILPPAEQAVSRMVQELQLTLRNLLIGYQRAFNAIWYPTAEAGYTTEEILAQLGTDAIELFQRAGQTKAFLNAIAPGLLENKYQTPPQEYDVHEDGTITLRQAE